MTNNADAQIAREWASKALDNVFLNEVPIEGYRAAARHILATTTPPTMADVEWDDAVHAGLCALCADGDLVRMIGPSLGNGGAIICHWVYCDSTVTGALPAENLTPLPGTRVDLTPRRESVPESTPDHPTVLTTEEDYESAPAGTVVAEDDASPWIKDDMGFWIIVGDDESETSWAMSHCARRVLRWGRAA